jgi:hypothetical protein
MAQVTGQPDAQVGQVVHRDGAEGRWRRRVPAGLPEGRKASRGLGLVRRRRLNGHGRASGWSAATCSPLP